MIGYAARGGGAFYAWVAALLVFVALGAWGYSRQLCEGLVVTNMSDQVSWGAYIANFTFLVGVAAAGIIVVASNYLYGRREFRDLVLLGELMALSAIVMCMLFVTVDLGRPDRFLHILPFFGKLNLPGSILAWDVVVLGGYLLLNLHIPGYLLYKRYCNEAPSAGLYLPLVFISLVWAISIHTVTAFLYSGLGGRPFWNSAILAPRFLVSAFAVGPAIMLLVFRALERVTKLQVDESGFELLKRVVLYTLPLNLFLFGCEVFTEFYTNSTHVESATYMFFGLHGHAMLTPYIWAGLLFNVIAIAIFVVPRWRDSEGLLTIACILCILGVWIEKGMGLVVPGFIPSPLGDLVEYTPSFVEFSVCLGIWSLGALLFSLLAKVAIGIQTGELSIDSQD